MSSVSGSAPALLAVYSAYGIYMYNLYIAREPLIECMNEKNLLTRCAKMRQKTMCSTHKLSKNRQKFSRFCSSFLTSFLILFLICGFTVTPVWAAELDDPICNYDISFGGEFASVVFNKNNGELLNFSFNNHNFNRTLFTNSDNPADDADYTFTATDILRILNDDPTDAVITDKNDNSEFTITHEELCQCVADNPNLVCEISNLADEEDTGINDTPVAGWINRLPKWARISVFVGCCVIAAIGGACAVGGCMSAAYICGTVITLICLSNSVFD